jgi:hypothetical protein
MGIPRNLVEEETKGGKHHQMQMDSRDTERSSYKKEGGRKCTQEITRAMRSCERVLTRNHREHNEL